MKNPFRRSARKLGAWALRTLCLVAVAGILSFTVTTGEAEADRYDPKKAGNPVRIAAYILHPVGVLLEPSNSTAVAPTRAADVRKSTSSNRLS